MEMQKVGCHVFVSIKYCCITTTATMCECTTFSFCVTIVSIDAHVQKFLLVESLMNPTAVFLLPAVIAGLRNDGTFNSNLNSSVPSTILSVCTRTLTLLIVIPLVKVAFIEVLIKSTPPVSQMLFSKHIRSNI